MLLEKVMPELQPFIEATRVAQQKPLRKIFKEFSNEGKTIIVYQDELQAKQRKNAHKSILWCINSVLRDKFKKLKTKKETSKEKLFSGVKGLIHSWAWKEGLKTVDEEEGKKFMERMKKEGKIQEKIKPSPPSLGKIIEKGSGVTQDSKEEVKPINTP